MAFGFDPAAPGASLAACEAAVALAFPSVPEIACAALAARREAGAPTLLLDLREAAEHAVSRIPGARRVAPGTPAAALDAPAAGTLVVCACAVGLRSARQAALLRAAGWPEVANLRGGVFRWAVEGRALDGGAAVHPFNALWGLLLPPALRQGAAA